MGDGIRLTFVTTNVRGSVEEFDTDSLRAALRAFVANGFSDEHPGPDKWVFAVVVERGGAKFDDDELIAELDHIARIERVRATR